MGCFYSKKQNKKDDRKNEYIQFQRNRIDELDNRIKSVCDEMQVKNNQILELINSNALISAEFIENKKKVVEQTEKIRELESCIATLSKDRDDLTANMKDMIIQNTQLQSDMDVIRTKLESESEEKKQINSLIDTFLKSNVDYILNDLLQVDDIRLIPNIIEYKCYEKVITKTKEYLQH